MSPAHIAETVTALQQIASVDSLRDAWRFIFAKARKASRDTQGIDGVSLNTFSPGSEPAIGRISRELTRRTFEFSDLLPHLVPKPSGKPRLICIPTVRDRIVQRALLNFLTAKYQRLLANHISYGFIPRRSVQDAGAQACKLRTDHQWALKTDITSFFDSISRDMLRERIRRTIRQTSLHSLAFMALACEIAPSSSPKAAQIRKLGVHPGKGIRQGMPLSPFFANLVLHPIDKWLIDDHIPAVRYADDLVLFADSQLECEQLFTRLSTRLQSLGLTAPPIGSDSKKSQIADPTQTIEFLGLELCGKDGGYVLQLSHDQISSIRSKLLGFSLVSTLLSRHISLRTLGATLQAECSGYLSAYDCCTNFDELRNAVNDVKRSALRKLYRDGLKIDIANASSEVRTFLELT